MNELTIRQRDLISMGLCPFCEQSIRGYKAPLGSFAPEAFVTLREAGIDPCNGHATDCKHREITI